MLSLQDEAYEEVVSLFMRMAAEQGITKAFVARRLGKKPEQITRLLSGPRKWTLATYSSLLLALGHKPRFGKERLRELRPTNEHHHAVAIGIESFEADPVAHLDDVEAAIRHLIGTDLA